MLLGGLTHNLELLGSNASLTANWSCSRMVHFSAALADIQLVFLSPVAFPNISAF